MKTTYRLPCLPKLQKRSQSIGKRQTKAAKCAEIFMQMLYATEVNSLSPICLRNTVIQVKEISQLASCTRGENCSSRVGLTRRDGDWKPLQNCKLVRVKLCCLWIISPIPSWISSLVLFWLENFAGISFQNTFWPVNGFVCPVEAKILFNFFWKVNFVKSVLFFIYWQTRRIVNTKFHVY